MRPINEQALSFPCAGCTLLGVASVPDRPAGEIGVVFVVGGPQTRVGAHRRFVTLARALAAAGFPALRFDVRGMGDSEGHPPGFEASAPDIEAAISALQRACPSVQRVVLWGLCDGASAAVLAWTQNRDPRVAGLCLVNPWVRTPAVQDTARVRHYYGRRLRDPAFWRKLLAGGVGAQALAGWWRAWRRSRAAPWEPNDFTRHMAAGLQAFGGPVLVVLSGRDHTAREFETLAQEGPAWRGLLARRTWTRVDHPDADHTHGGQAARAALERDVVAWMVANFTGPRA